MEEKPQLVVSSPIDLVATVPYLLGIRPVESLVVVGVDDHKVNVVARMDLGVAAADLPMIQTRLFQLGRPPDRRFIVMAYTVDPDGDACKAVLGTLQAFGESRVGTIILVNGDKAEIDGDGVWRDVPDRYQPAVEAGLADPLSDRSALAATIAGPAPELADSAEQWWRSAQEQQHIEHTDAVEMAAIFIETAAHDGPLTGPFCALLARLVSDEDVRGAVLMSITDETAQQHVDVWRQVVQKVPDEAAPPVLGLLAVSAWIAREGVLQTCALERGLDIDPDHPLLKLALKINQSALPPIEWEQLRSTILASRDEDGLADVTKLEDTMRLVSTHRDRTVDTDITETEHSPEPEPDPDPVFRMPAPTVQSVAL